MPKIARSVEWPVAFRQRAELLESGRASIRCRSGATGRFDANEEHIPSDVFAGGCGASAWKGLIQHHQVGDFVNLCQKPVGKRTTAGAGNLPAQQLDRAFKDAV